MKAENLILDDGSQRKVVEELSEVSPHVSVTVLPKALVIESVDLSDLSRLVVASENGDSILISHFEYDQKSHCFDRIVSAVNVVAHEKIVSLRNVPANSEEFH